MPVVSRVVLGLIALLPFGLVLGPRPAGAVDSTIPREIRDPEEWKGKMVPPSPLCPPNFNNPRKDPYIFSCKAAIIGDVTNVKAFAPGPYEDKGDPDWQVLKQYWETGRLFYFAATQCAGGLTPNSDGAARQEAAFWAGKRVRRWDGELKASKFRPFLAFREIKTVYDCVPGVLRPNGGNGMTAEEQQDAEGERAADAAADAAARAAQAARDNQVIFQMTSNDTKKIRINFRAQGRDNVWPASDRSYVVEAFDGAAKTYTLSCQRGEKICYGAWRESDESVGWGVGRHGRSGCQNCCTTCGSGTKAVSLNAGPSGPPRDRLSFNVTSNDRFKVFVDFVSQSRNRAWPGGGNSYVLADSNAHRFDLTCEPGEKICWGAFRQGGNKYWGAGQSAKQACTGCCMTCGSGLHTVSLDDAGPSGGGGGGVSSAIDALGAGIAIGSALGGLAGGRGGGGIRQSPPSYGPGRGPPQSGISGGR